MAAQPVYSLADLVESAMDTTQPQNLRTLSTLVSGTSSPSTLSGMGTLRGTPALSGMQKSDLPRSGVNDWSNQELASLYRAQRLLNLTGITFDTDRGLSDENDPWFIFVDAQDQVLAHFCRIDGLYHFDSAAQDGLLSATSLEALVGRFARRGNAVDAAAGPRDGAAQVIVFDSGTRARVLMHPGVSLAALIWSVYVLSDGLVLPEWHTDAETIDASDPALIDSAVLATSALSVTALPHDIAAADPTVPVDPREAGTAANATLATGTSATANVTAPFSGIAGSYAMNVVGWSLATLSISHGIHHWVLPATSQLVAQDVLATIATAFVEGPAEIQADVKSLIMDLSDAIDVLIQTQLVQIQTQSAAQDTAAAFVSGVVDHGKLALEHPETASLTLEASKPQTAAPTEDPAEAPVAQTPQTPVTETGAESTITEAAGDQTQRVSKQDFFQSLSKFDIVDIKDFDLLAQTLPLYDLSFMDQTSFGAQDTGVTFVIDEVTAPAPSYTLFDQTAHDFVVYFLTKNQDPQRSSYNGETILIDMAAIEGAEGDVYARSWTFDDGSVLSTVGLKSDFEVFGLVV